MHMQRYAISHIAKYMPDRTFFEKSQNAIFRPFIVQLVAEWIERVKCLEIMKVT